MPERLNAVAAVLARWSRNTPASEDVMQRIAADRSAREARRQSNQVNGGGAGNGIAVLPLYGMVTQRGNMVDDVSGPGSVSTQQFAASLRQALTDESVSQILIDIDSPGGSVYGVAELADEIISARAQKPVIAIANSLAASAAYWIGACASEFYVTPGGEVGSIGVWQAHQDYSKAMDEAGVKTTLISAGKFKVEGNPYTPLDEDAQAFMQSRVDDYYAAFTKAVAKGRGVSIAQVRDGMGQGRVLGAEAALASNMVDGIASLDDVVRKMRRNAKVQNKPQASRLLQARNSLAYL
ncbi:peptidase S49 [Limnohabitans sp. MMS-10A-192]|nr:peptidase S49 [Limnohabitans sp. MMS-10A-192]